jgi:CHAD domain-containing protein
MLHGVAEGDIRAIHRTRVASRRLRELLPILQLRGSVSNKLSHRLRQVTRGLGVVRELDVLLLLVEEFESTGRYPDDALMRLREDIRRSRDEVEGKLKGKKLANNLRRVGRKIESVLEDLKSDDTAEEKRGWRWVLDARIARRAATLQAAIDQAGAVYLPERLHDVRIALKKLRYALELSAEASGVSRAPEINPLKRAQELLGRMRDLQVLLDRSRQLQASLRPPDLKTWRTLDTLIAMLEDSCRALHAKYVRQRIALAAVCDKNESRPQARRSRRVG